MFRRVIRKIRLVGEAIVLMVNGALIVVAAAHARFAVAMEQTSDSTSTASQVIAAAPLAAVGLFLLLWPVALIIYRRED